MATREYQRPGGKLFITDPDPLEVATKMAELAAKQQQPGFESRKISVEEQNALRAWQELQQRGQIAGGQQAEETRYHTGTLDEARATRQANVEEAQRKLAEDTRYHTGTLGESAADREARVNQAKDAIKAGQIGDIIHALGPQLSSEPGKLAAVLSAYGDPAYGQAEKSFNEAKTRQQGEQLFAGIKSANIKPEDVSKAVAGADPAIANAAWNAYKAANPTVLGPPPPAAAPTTTTTAGAVAPPPPTPQVRTEDRGLVNASMGLVGEGGKVLPIPGATPGIDYTGGATQVATALPPPVTTTPGQPSVAALTRGQQFAAFMEPSATMPTPAPAVASNVRPPDINVDALLQNVVGTPSAEELERRRRSQQPIGLTPFRTNQY